MKKLNAIQKSRYINENYKDFLRSSFKFGNEKLNKLYIDQLENEVLLKGPFIDLNLPFVRGKNISELIEEGVLCKSFKKLSGLDFERPLYSHQERSIRQVKSGRGAVITTGTGSGKTESFLFPILNEILSDIENGNSELGVRAIFLYPMNALVNDQIDRIRKMLINCPEITYGFYTGDTPENGSSGFRKKNAEEGVVIPSNELISRKEIRSKPPHLLFTNYSMLEYLLIRPNDYSIISEEKLKNWKFVVLDEAHSYTGSLGIELSMLLRRVTAMAPQRPRFILTSATLGEQGKSDKDIAEFAENLTSSDFKEKDIIFSERIPVAPKGNGYMISSEDYEKILENIMDIDFVRFISNKYISTSSESIPEILYDLLESDDNTLKLYGLLKDGCKSYQEIIGNFNPELTDSQLTALIDLINMASRNDIGLFDLKYHSFVRPLSGAYVTLGESQKLSLTKTNHIDGNKAFEIGNCRFCNAPYIIGKIQYNNELMCDFLFQNNEVDIYENYGENEHVNLDYFLLSNSDDDTDEENGKNELEEDVLCGKCGCIFAKSNLNANRCECDDSQKISVFRVVNKNKDDEEKAFNNINHCCCCGHRSHSGIVKSLNLGKDEGTAIVAQLLYEAIDTGEEKLVKASKLSLRSKKTEKNTNIKTKQFLEFSDSRQQASFAATFFDSNHVRMLQKRLIWKVIEDYNYSDICFDELTAELEKEIKSKELLKNDLNAHKNAWVAALNDLLKVDGAYDGEGLGLYYFDLDVSDIIENLDDDELREEFQDEKLNKKDLETLMQMIVGLFKTTPAINYTKSTLTPEEKLEYLEYRRFDNYVSLVNEKKIKSIRSLLPLKGNENLIIRYVKKACGCNNKRAEEIVKIIFDLFSKPGTSDFPEAEKLVFKNESREAYQLLSGRFILKNYKTHQYYQCSKCSRLTPYNIHNVCPTDKCDGKLVKIDPDDALAMNYYRNKYKTKKIERIVIREHTAQIQRKEAKKIQDDFKNKLVNIISCSTTFEMGIDIGDLETVFMRNIPPSPANYVQRAGRAGRRKDSSAYILTYCGTSSHDYTYFVSPDKMISGKIEPPYFNVVNSKIIVRHLMAASLGFFFRKNPDYFEKFDLLVYEDGVEKFEEYLQTHPKDLNEYINQKVMPERKFSKFHDFKWFDQMNGKDVNLSRFVDVFKKMYEEYTTAIENAQKDSRPKDANIFIDQRDNLKKQNVLKMLSKYCVIPKYGFPVDVVDLQVYNNGKINNQLDLSRDLKIAISEYAPDSEIIADGKKYTSKYISLPKTSSFPKNYFCTCFKCKRVNTYLSRSTADKCKYCGEDIDCSTSEYFIEPVYGFKTGETKESSRMKPKRSYAGEVVYMGGGILDDMELCINDDLSVHTTSDDELLVLNKSNFYMCPVCGFSNINKGKVKFQTVNEKHMNYRGYTCGCEEMNLLRIGHRFKTDVARVEIPDLVSYENNSYSTALSFMYAFLEGMSKALGIERTDIDSVLELNLEKGSYDILLYDNVPGGAGHVKRIISKDAFMSSLREALNKVSQTCCDEKTSCYNCLRNYYNQNHHSRINRKEAKDFILSLVDKLQD